MPEVGAYRTDDLALATVLALAGFKYQLLKVTETKALWVFEYPPEREEDFDILVDEYDGWTSKVEPRAFVARWGELRRELFALIPPLPRRRPVAPASAS